jgi:hypothetical protein
VKGDGEGKGKGEGGGAGMGVGDDASTRIGSCSESVSTEADWGDDLTDLEKAAKKAEKRRRQKQEQRAKAGGMKAHAVEQMTGSTDKFDLNIKEDDPVEWPLVRCSGIQTRGCQTVAKWSRMHSLWHESGKLWWYFCVKCVAKRDQTTENEAKAFIASTSPGAESKRTRLSKFAEAVQNVQESFPVKGETGERVVNLGQMTDLFSPLFAFILRKRRALEKEAKEFEAHKQLCEDLKTAATVEAQEEIMQRIEGLEEWQQESFKGHDKSEAQRLLQASTYADEWVTQRAPDGRVLGRMCSYYVCGAGLGNGRRCMAVIPSKRWDTKGAGIDARRWYCMAASGCTAKYRAGWGQLVQLELPSSDGTRLDVYYMRAEVPPWDVEDVRGCALEATHKPQTAEELYTALATIEPVRSSIVVETSPGHTHICDEQVWDQLPYFKWWQIFNFIGMEPPKVGKKTAREANV